MVPADIGAELAAALRAAAEAGELPWTVVGLPATGTWRPAPPGEDGGPGTYASSLPMLIARRVSQEAGTTAERLARALAPVPWIAAARASGRGYLTVTVTTDHLTALPARIVAAGRRTVLVTPRMPDPAAAPDWQQAWSAQHGAVVARLTEAAAWADPVHEPEHPDVANRRREADSPPGFAATARRAWPAGDDRGPVAAAAAWSGAEAVRYVLARTARPGRAAIERQLRLPLDLGNPYVLVRYAHAHAASTVRWAAELAEAEMAAGEVAGPERAPAPEPAELALIDLLSWSAERLAAAGRRRRPAELCGYLEQLAVTYLYCAQSCPALPYGGAAAPPYPAGPQAARRREIAEAARAVIGGGLQLAGISAPVRLTGL